ncbi:transcription elongation factor SPT6-like [Tropilaelaps mercedesae]|uniref:Transcription elongation factor SPT6-like n=1 Tax=Tropilaelaps mercedesae TaxID=418985 RepID=A0A1V9X2Y4_9ACAR|nr:transcription elongation factor SPT6-like [Tropilaelaps mercedesae]
MSGRGCPETLRDDQNLSGDEDAPTLFGPTSSSANGAELFSYKGKDESLARMTSSLANLAAIATSLGPISRSFCDDVEGTKKNENHKPGSSGVVIEKRRHQDDRYELIGQRLVVQPKRKKEVDLAVIPDADQNQRTGNRTARSDQFEQAGVYGVNQQGGAEAAFQNPANYLQRYEESESSGEDELSSHETESEDNSEMSSICDENASTASPSAHVQKNKVREGCLNKCNVLEELAAWSIGEVERFDEPLALQRLGNITAIVPFPELDYNSEAPRLIKPHFHDFPHDELSLSDREVALKDEPERYQLRPVPVLSADDEELKAEAEWIFHHCFNTRTISMQTLLHVQVPPLLMVEGLEPLDMMYPLHQPLGGRRSPSRVQDIFAALKCIRQQQLDIPFIRKYRQELIGVLCDYDLWLIYRWDERWCRLNHAKRSMERVLRETQSYLPTLAEFNYSGRLRKVQEADFQRLREVQTPEELRDIYQHFVLYYSHEVPGLALAFELLVRNAEDLLRQQDRPDLSLPLAQLTSVDPSGACSFSVDEAAYAYVTSPSESRFTKIGDCARLRKTALYGLAHWFGLTAEQFGENLREDTQRHKVVRCPVAPLEEAALYVNDTLKTPEEALRAARYIVAREIAHDPIVRRVVRKAFFEQAVLNARPSVEGRDKLSEQDDVYPLAYLVDKPVQSLKADEYLKMKNAEDDGLLEITIRIDNALVTKETSYIMGAYRVYGSEENSLADILWKKEREDALSWAFYGILYPAFERELKCRLLREARDHVLLTCANKLHEYLTISPYVPSPKCRDSNSQPIESKILGIAYGTDEDEVSYGVLINSMGRPIDVLQFNYFGCKPGSLFAVEEVMAAQETEKLRQLLRDEEPHCVVIGANDRMAPRVKAAMERLIRDVKYPHEQPHIEVFLLDDQLAKIYSETSWSDVELLKSCLQVKEAASLARRMQDPLCEFAQLCGRDAEITTLKYHPLQRYVPKHELEQVVVAEFVNRVNNVGLDINRCCTDFRTLRMLQFVSGFGQRKALRLVQSYAANSSPLTQRSDLISKLKLGPKEYLNSAAFFRIVPESLPVELRGRVSLLDNSRIHPEMYWCVIKLARRILNDETRDPNEAVKELAERHSRHLNMTPLIESMENYGLGKKYSTLCDISNELKISFHDKRYPYIEPDRVKLFYEIIRETPHTFYEGKLVTFEVVGKKMGPKRKYTLREVSTMSANFGGETHLYECPICFEDGFESLLSVEQHLLGTECPGPVLGVEVCLTNGAYGFILIKYLTDQGDPRPYEWFQLGRTGRGRILRINFEELSVELTCRQFDIDDQAKLLKPEKDDYFGYLEQQKDRVLRRQDEEAKWASRYETNQPDFLELDRSCIILERDEVGEVLKTKRQGDVVCWPSPKGKRFLNMTWKVHDDIFQTVEAEITSCTSRSIVCEISGEEFRGVGDAISRHIYPMAAYARQILEHKYFKDFAGEEKSLAEVWLKARTRRSCGDGLKVFCLSAFKQYPGKFLFAYDDSGHIVNDVITVTPGGFYYRHRVFLSLSSVLQCRFSRLV